MPRKRLKFHQIHRVILLEHDGSARCLKSVDPGTVRLATGDGGSIPITNDAPNWCYVAVKDGIILPKRKQRSDKFVVQYSTLHEKEL